MNTIKTFVTFALLASLTIGSTIAITSAFAAKSSGSNGLEKADENVHENAPEERDVTFHEGLCQGGYSTEALDNLGGCDSSVITDPGNSDDHRQD